MVSLGTCSFVDVLVFQTVSGTQHFREPPCWVWFESLVRMVKFSIYSIQTGSEFHNIASSINITKNPPVAAFPFQSIYPINPSPPVNIKTICLIFCSHIHEHAVQSFREACGKACIMYLVWHWHRNYIYLLIRYINNNRCSEFPATILQQFRDKHR